jgi:1-acyl-sn-glycerol-3-phosphate acyltransferase
MSEGTNRLAGALTRVITRTVRPIAQRFFDLEVTGQEHVPRHGGLVVAANHLSHIDPVLVTISLDREVRYIAVDELFGSGTVFDAVTLFFGAIPTDRDGVPLNALKEAIRHVRAGGAVGLFPEGRRVTHWGESAPKRGAAWLAWMTGAPLLPVAVHGTQKVLSPATDETIGRPSLRVWIEPPLLWHEFGEYVDPLGAMTEQWRQRVGGHAASWWARR